MVLRLGSCSPRAVALVGLSRFELLTPRLSSVCSNQLSYRPRNRDVLKEPSRSDPVPSKLDRTCVHSTGEYQIDLDWSAFACLRRVRRDVSRKEVIQPQVLLQLPCYDFTPITSHTLGAFPPFGLDQRLLVQPTFVV